MTDDSTVYDVVVTGVRADGGKYQGVDNCKVCHQDFYDGWSETGHGKDFTPGSGVRPAVNQYAPDPDYSDRCGVCHVVGLGDTESGGFDPSEPWASTTPTADQDVANIDLIGIQCEACHGPGGDHLALSNDDKEIDPMIDGNPSTEDSCWGNGDSACHGPSGHDKYSVLWDSAHSPQDEIDAIADGEHPHYMDTYCSECHSPSQWNESASRSTAEEILIEDYRGVGCGDCHDPHSDEYEYQLRNTAEELCEDCHTAYPDGRSPSSRAPHHNQGESYNGFQANGVTGQKGMVGVSCVDCHMWESPEVSHGYYMSDALDIELHESHSFEPTAQACADCHSDLMSKMPEHGRPDNNTGDNEELWNEWDEWGMEWNETVEMWEMVIHDWQENYERLYANTEANYDAAEQAFTDAEANGTKSADVLAEAEEILDLAWWNMVSSNDESAGAHNPTFFAGLLNQANIDALKVLKMLGMNDAPMAHAGMSQLVNTGDEVSFDGSGSFDRDGTIDSYFWDFGDGTNGTTMTATHTYNTPGSYLVMLTVTDSEGQMDTDMISVFVIDPVDLSAIEQKNAEQDAKNAEQDAKNAEQDTAITAATTGGDNDEIDTLSDDIADVEDSVSSVKTMLIIGLIVVLIIVLGIGYWTLEDVKKEISKEKK